MRKRRIRRIVLTVLGLAVIALAINFFATRKAALDRFAYYENLAVSVDTSYGRIGYIDEGEG